jgi:DNA-directed RNA polymerase specialized sigma24 family protein
MEKQLFVDVYEDKVFRQKAENMIASIYKTYAQSLEDSGYDLDDFIQEMWSELFEENTFTADLAWCFDTMRHNAIDLCRVSSRRNEIAPIFNPEEDSEDDHLIQDTKKYDGASFPIREKAFT